MPREQSIPATAICQNPDCGKIFTPGKNTKGWYCSRSCSARHIMSDKTRHPRWKGGDLELICTNCGCDFTRKRLGARTEKTEQFCSVDCKIAYQRGPNSPNWKGGRVIDAQGYVRVYVGREHPMAMGNGYVLEHRLVAADALGRSLDSTEVVHHQELGFDARSENHPDVLDVLPGGHSEHMRLHHRLRKQPK